jgi:GWxTD domain-containing protein
MRTRTRFFGGAVLAAAVLAAACQSVPKMNLDPESGTFYEAARLIMTKEETKIFSLLPDAESRREFIADFWEKRDPDLSTPENEYKQEFEARVDYANRRFMEGGPGMNTDRGRIHIYMGPPDKFEEFFRHTDTSVRGAILWWIYYDHRLGIEFVDEQGTGRYKIRTYDGDFFGAMDLIKLGHHVKADDVFRKKFVKFEVTYDRGRGELEVGIPSDALVFRENDDGDLQADLNFVFYIYGNEGLTKETHREARSVVVTDRELEGLKTVNLGFAYPLKPGTNFVDVIIQGRESSSSKIRRIFEIKVAG